MLIITIQKHQIFVNKIYIAFFGGLSKIGNLSLNNDMEKRIVVGLWYVRDLHSHQSEEKAVREKQKKKKRGGRARGSKPKMTSRPFGQSFSQ